MNTAEHFNSLAFVKAMNSFERLARNAIKKKADHRFLIELINCHHEDSPARDDIRRGINKGLQDQIKQRGAITFGSMPREIWALADPKLLASIAAYMLYESGPYGEYILPDVEKFVNFVEEDPKRNAIFVKELALRGVTYRMEDSLEESPVGEKYSMALVHNPERSNFRFISGCKDHSIEEMIVYYKHMKGRKGVYRRQRAVPTIFKLLIEQGEVAQRANYKNGLKAVQDELTARMAQIESLGYGEVIRPHMRERMARLLGSPEV